MKIAGIKDFYTEYKIIDNRTGYAKIWFGGNSIGTNEDIIFLQGYLLSGLEQIENSPYYNFEVTDDKTQLYNDLHKIPVGKELYNTKYLINFGTFCDDFVVFSFVKDNEIHIIWKLLSNETPFKDPNYQSMDINYFKINKEMYKNIFNQIKLSILSDINNC